MMTPIKNAWAERWKGRVPPEFHADLTAALHSMFACGFIAALAAISETPEDQMGALVDGARAEVLMEAADAGMPVTMTGAGMVS